MSRIRQARAHDNFARAANAIVERALKTGRLDKHEAKEILERFNATKLLRQMTPDEAEKRMDGLFGDLYAVYWWARREISVVNNVKKLLANICEESRQNPESTAPPLRKIETEFGGPKDEPILL